MDIIGTIAFTISGYIVGARNKFDALGIFFISFVSAFGGGVIRDLLVGRTPFIFTENYPLLISLVAVVVSYLFRLDAKENLENSRIFVWSDTIGLSVFAVTGALIGLEYNFNFMGVVFLALLTATGGGIIRDIILNKIPYVFGHDFYGTISIILGSLIFIFQDFLSLYSNAGIYFLIFLGVLMRLLAVKNKWSIPKVTGSNNT